MLMQVCASSKLHEPVEKTPTRSRPGSAGGPGSSALLQLLLADLIDRVEYLTYLPAQPVEPRDPSAAQSRSLNNRTDVCIIDIDDRSLQRCFARDPFTPFQARTGLQPWTGRSRSSASVAGGRPAGSGLPTHQPASAEFCGMFFRQKARRRGLHGSIHGGQMPAGRATRGPADTDQQAHGGRSRARFQAARGCPRHPMAQSRDYSPRALHRERGTTEAWHDSCCFVTLRCGHREVSDSWSASRCSKASSPRLQGCCRHRPRGLRQ